MADYNVFLVKLGAFSINQSAVAAALQSLLTRVLAGGSAALRGRFAGATVRWMTACPSVERWELLIYFVRSSLDSVVSALGGTTSGDGLTAWRGGVTGSEVYANTGGGTDSQLLAHLAFHEALHNKLNWTGTQLHPRGGLASAVVTPSTSLTSANITLMAGVLGNNRPQWTSGCDTFNDPLRGL